MSPAKNSRGPLPAPRLAEDQFLQQVRDLAKLTGWKTYHTHNSQRSEPGWPDLVLASSAQRRTLFIELKAADGKVSEPQQMWLDLLAASGLETGVWRPADLPAIRAILRGRRIGAAQPDGRDRPA